MYQGLSYWIAILLALRLVGAGALSLHVLPGALGEVVRSFEEANVFPDVLPEFIPRGILEVQFDKRTEIRQAGVRISQTRTSSQPRFNFDPVSDMITSENDRFTILIIDPDSPLKADPDGGKLHMLGTNLRIQSRHKLVESYAIVNETAMLVGYLGPAPKLGTGFHRYTFLLYKAVANGASIERFNAQNFTRTGFNVTQFASAAGLGTPLAATFMNVENALEDTQASKNITQTTSLGAKSSASLIIGRGTWNSIGFSIFISLASVL